MEGPAGSSTRLRLPRRAWDCSCRRRPVADHPPRPRVRRGRPAMITTRLGGSTGASSSTRSAARRAPSELAIPASQVRRDQAGGVVIVVAVVLASVGAGVVVATVTARRLADPLTRVADRASAMARGRLSIGVARYGIPSSTACRGPSGNQHRDRDAARPRGRHRRRGVTPAANRLTAIQLRLDELARTRTRTSSPRRGRGQPGRPPHAELDEMVVASRTSEATPASAVDIRPMVARWSLISAGVRPQGGGADRGAPPSRPSWDRSAQPAAGGARGAAGQRCTTVATGPP